MGISVFYCFYFTKKKKERKKERKKEEKNLEFPIYFTIFRIPIFRITNLTVTLLRGWWGRCEKNYLRKEEGREGGEKSGRSAPAGPGARTRGSNPGPAAC